MSMSDPAHERSKERGPPRNDLPQGDNHGLLTDLGGPVLQESREARKVDDRDEFHPPLLANRLTHPPDRMDAGERGTIGGTFDHSF